jgi:hypothetical protein
MSNALKVAEPIKLPYIFDSTYNSIESRAMAIGENSYM